MQAAVIAADAVAEIPVFLEDALGVIDSITAGLCQFQVVFVAHEQGDLQLFFQFFHRARQCRLRRVQVLGCPGQGAGLGEGDKLCKQVRFYHSGSFLCFSI